MEQQRQYAKRYDGAARVAAYRSSEKGKATIARYEHERIVSGKNAQKNARYRRRMADERAGAPDPRLDALLEGVLTCPE